MHTALVVAWGVRLALFLLHREFINWKEWHAKVKEVDQRSKITSKFSTWTSCALFYVSLVMPCFYRMRQAAFMIIDSTAADADIMGMAPFIPDRFKSSLWGALGISGIMLQIIGILMESIADFQKATFKATTIVSGSQTLTPNRNKWCHVGLWKYFTHPNYLGEIMFWAGTFMAGLGASQTIAQTVIATIGFLAVLVILLGATEQLNKKQWNQYKRNPDYVEFREKFGFLGPKLANQEPSTMKVGRRQR